MFEFFCTVSAFNVLPYICNTFTPCTSSSAPIETYPIAFFFCATVSSTKLAESAVSASVLVKSDAPVSLFFSSKPISCENVLRVPDPSSLVITITFPNLSRPDICSFNMLSCVPTERQPQIAVKTMILHVLSTISVFAIFKMIIYHPYGL